MDQYLVSLDVVTGCKMSGDEICELMGVTHYGGEYWQTERDFWRFESQKDDSEPLDEHLRDLSSTISFKVPLSKNSNINDLVLMIGVLWDTSLTEDCHMRLSAESMNLISENWPGVRLEMVCYACAEDQGRIGER